MSIKMNTPKLLRPTWKDDGQMTEHCLALLSYVEKHRNEEQSISLLSERCGIPNTSLTMILDQVVDCGTESMLFGIAMMYGYDFCLFAGYKDSVNRHERARVIDVVKCDWGKLKYNPGHYLYQGD